MRFLTLLWALTLPFPAAALSCLPHNAISSFKHAEKSDDDYVAVLGDLSFNPEKLPKVDWNWQQDVQPDNFLTGRLIGKSLTRNGFTALFERMIDINVQCAGPWCSGLSQGRHLVFLKRENGAYLLEASPCGGFAHADPSDDMLGKIQTCMRGGPCKTDLPN